jgi:hypothetical protein
MTLRYFRSIRRRLNPSFQERYQTFQRERVLTSAQVAARVGISRQQNLSTLIHADAVPTTPVALMRLECVADLVGFPRDQIFAGDPVIRPFELPCYPLNHVN